MALKVLKLKNVWFKKVHVTLEADSHMGCTEHNPQFGTRLVHLKKGDVITVKLPQDWALSVGDKLDFKSVLQENYQPVWDGQVRTRSASTLIQEHI